MVNKVVIAFLLLSVVVLAGAQKVGGVGAEKPVDEKVITIANAVRDAAQAKVASDVTFHSYTPMTYATQVVAGINYFIKVDIGATDCIVLRVFSSFDGSLSLHSVKSHVDKDAPISYF